jgi:hypothetical protein
MVSVLASDYQSVNSGSQPHRGEPNFIAWGKLAQSYNPYKLRQTDTTLRSQTVPQKAVFMATKFMTIKLMTIKVPLSYLALAILCWTSVASAQQSGSPPPAPVPPQISAAHKVFISNAGGESFENIISEIVFNGGADRPYNQCYAALKSWGHYDLVSSPADADLVLEVSWVLTDTGLRLPVLGQLRLVVIDPRTHVTLWNFTEYVRGAILLSNRDKNFDQAMTTIVNRMKILVTPPPAPVSAPQ